MIKVFQVIECGGQGGSGAQAAAICNALDPARFDVGLVYGTRPPISPDDYRALARGARQAFHVPQLCREITPLRDFAALIRLVDLFRREKPDVVHAHCSKAGVLARVAALLAGVPRVFYSPRGYSFLMLDCSAATRAFYRLIERSVSWIGEIVAVSESEAALAREVSWGKPVHVAPDPYWPELPPPRPASGEHEIRVGACGRLTYARNPEAFVRLAQRLTDSRSGLSCVWIGDGELGPAVREMVHDLNLSSRLELTGWLPPEAARRRLGELDVLVHYSRWEGLPNVVIEAMAAGVPVVASDVPGNRDAVADGETGLIAKDEAALLEKTLALVDDRERRARMGKAARERVVERFAPGKTMKILEELYLGRALSREDQ